MELLRSSGFNAERHGADALASNRSPTGQLHRVVQSRNTGGAERLVLPRTHPSPPTSQISIVCLRKRLTWQKEQLPLIFIWLSKRTCPERPIIKALS